MSQDGLEDEGTERGVKWAASGLAEAGIRGRHVNDPQRRIEEKCVTTPPHLHKENKEKRADDTVPPWSETGAWL